jgi:hypothetical protein
MRSSSTPPTMPSSATAWPTVSSTTCPTTPVRKKAGPVSRPRSLPCECSDWPSTPACGAPQAKPIEQLPHLADVVEGHAVRPSPPVTRPEELPSEHPARHKSITDRRPHPGEICRSAERQAVPGMNQVRLRQHGLREGRLHDLHQAAAPHLFTQHAKRYRVPVDRRHHPAATRQGQCVRPGTASQINRRPARSGAEQFARPQQERARLAPDCPHVVPVPPRRHFAVTGRGTPHRCHSGILPPAQRRPQETRRQQRAGHGRTEYECTTGLGGYLAFGQAIGGE